MGYTKMEPLKQIADTTLLLSYVTNFFLTLIIAIAGAFVREIYNYKKSTTKVSIGRLLSSGSLVSVVMTAVVENWEINFAVFALITFFFGMWAFSIIEILMNAKYIAIVCKDVLKELGNPLLKGVSNSIEDVRKEMKEEKKDKKDESKPEEQNKQSEEKDKHQPEEERRHPDNSMPEVTTIPEGVTKEELLKQIRKLESELAKQVEEEQDNQETN